jgi:glutaconate CoA-transferase subunit B
MTLLTVHPGVAIDDVRANMGWDPRLAEPVGETPSPSEEELRLIRSELDPEGVYTS